MAEEVALGDIPAKRSLREKADAAAESTWTKLFSRASMILTPFLFSAVIGLAGLMYEGAKDTVNDIAGTVSTLSDKVSQVIVNQAVSMSERDDMRRQMSQMAESQKEQNQQFRDSIGRIWQSIAPTPKNHQ